MVHSFDALILDIAQLDLSYCREESLLEVFPRDKQSWNGRFADDEYTALICSGAYEGDVRAMDIFKSAHEDDFLLNSRYMTINNSIVKYIGNNYFEMIKNGNVSKKFPWNIIPEGTAYLANITGKHVGGLSQLDIYELLPEEKEQP